MGVHGKGAYASVVTSATGSMLEPERLIDAAFEVARAAVPEIFAADSALHVARQAKFEHVCVVLALLLGTMEGREQVRVLEAMIDRLEVGLREAAVGDMSVGKQMRVLAGALNGRLERYKILIEKEDLVGLAVAAGEHGVGAGGVEKMKKGLAEWVVVG